MNQEPPDDARAVRLAPTIVGRGGRLLDGLPSIQLELVQSEISPTGYLLVDYRGRPGEGRNREQREGDRGERGGKRVRGVQDPRHGDLRIAAVALCGDVGILGAYGRRYKQARTPLTRKARPVAQLQAMVVR